jgi:hypothetical protein
MAILQRVIMAFPSFFFQCPDPFLQLDHPQLPADEDLVHLPQFVVFLLQFGGALPDTLL